MKHSKPNYRPIRNLRVEPLEERRMLTIFTVTSLDDTGSGSLREAITSANATVEPDEINFAVEGVINIGSQLPTITNPLTITGPGAELLTIDAGNGLDGEFATGDGWRIFQIFDNNANSEFDVTLSGLTLTGGDTARGIDDAPQRNGQAGGAIASLENLTVIDSVITGNATGDGGNSTAPFGIGGTGGHGAGIFAGYGVLTILNSTIAGNRTGTNGTGGIQDGRGGSGGGISAGGIDIFVSNSVISGNQTQGRSAYGAGISNAYGNLTVTGSTISGNSTSGAFASGAGIAHRFGNLSIETSTIANNSATGADAGGGGIWTRTNADQGSVEISQSTVSGNSVADDEGGGILNWSEMVTISSSTITNNSAPTNGGSGVFSFSGTVSTMNFYNTIVAGNVNDDLAVSSSSPNPFHSQGFNLIGDARFSSLLGSFNQPGDVTNVLDPLLGPLADNGGPTETHEPQSGSPAIDMGDDNFAPPPNFDQRGEPFVRIVNGRMDVGAVEVQQTVVEDNADFDQDGIVNGTDFLLWQRGHGKPAPTATKGDGDADNDQDVDDDDLLIWRNQYGTNSAPAIAFSQSTLATAAALPENSVIFDSSAGPLTAEIVDAALAVRQLTDGGRSSQRMCIRPATRQLAFEKFDSDAESFRVLTRHKATGTAKPLIERASFVVVEEPNRPQQGDDDNFFAANLDGHSVEVLSRADA